MRIAAGDWNGDGRDEIITGAGVGGGPHVRVFVVQTMEAISDFFAFDPDFQGGVHVATGDLDDDGHAEIVVGASSGAGPHVRVYSIHQELLADYYSLEQFGSDCAKVNWLCSELEL